MNALAALVTTAVVVLYLFAYTPLKVRTPLSTLVFAELLHASSGHGREPIRSPASRSGRTSLIIATIRECAAGGTLSCFRATVWYWA